MLDRLDHVTIAVRDLAAAQRTYVSLLGRSPAWQASNPANGARSVFFRLANTQIELATPDGAGDRGDALRAQLEEHAEGLHAMALGTPDLGATTRSLQERGIELPAPEPRLSQDGPSGAWQRWQQCDIPRVEAGGVRVELIESQSLSEEALPSLPIGDEDATAGRLDHVVVFSNAPDGALQFYRDTLGIRLALDRTFPKRRTRILFFRLGGATIEIGAPLDPDPAQGSEESPRSDRLWGLAYQVADIEAAHARMQATGLEISATRDGHKPGTRVFSVKDPCHGVPTLIIEPVAR